MAINQQYNSNSNFVDILNSKLNTSNNSIRKVNLTRAGLAQVGLIQQLVNNDKLYKELLKSDTNNILHLLDINYNCKTQSIINLYNIMVNNNTSDDIDIITTYNILNYEKIKAFDYDINNTYYITSIITSIITECIYSKIDTDKLQNIASKVIHSIASNELMYLNIIKVITTIGMNTLYLIISIGLGEISNWPIGNHATADSLIVKSISKLKYTDKEIATLIKKRCTDKQLEYIKLLEQVCSESQSISTEDILNLSSNYRNYTDGNDK